MTGRDGKQIDDLLREALDAEVDEQEKREAITSLGIDVPRLATRLRQQVADHDAAERKRRWAEAERQREDALRRLMASEEPDEQLSLPELLGVLRGLLVQAGPAAGMHFMKFENATEDDVRQAIRAMRHLLKERDGDR